MARAINPVAPRAKVRAMAGTSSRLDIEYDARTAFDFLISLEGHGEHEKEPDLLPEDAAWLKRSFAALSAEQKADLERHFGEESIGLPYALPAILVDKPEIKDAKSFVSAVRTTSGEKLAGILVGGLMRMHGQDDLGAEVMSGDKEALETACEPWDANKRDRLADFVTHRDEELDRMIGVLEAWLPLYQEVEPRVNAMLKRDVATQKQENAKFDGDVPTLVERTTGGLRWFPEPGVRRVILAPQYFGRPFNYIFNGPDWRLLGYPIAETSLGATDAVMPPQTMVRLYRALGDTTRMRVLRLLSDRDLYLTELAQQLELSKPTMKHHLALLRAAGLVTVTEEGSLTYYSLRRDRVREAGLELQSYIS
jgi:DNA-binding transcriptional ArsR family regulator